MENKVNQRIKQFLKAEKVSQEKFCEVIGVSLDTLKKAFQRGSDPNLQIIKGISEHYPAHNHS